MTAQNRSEWSVLLGILEVRRVLRAAEADIKSALNATDVNLPMTVARARVIMEIDATTTRLCLGDLASRLGAHRTSLRPQVLELESLGYLTRSRNTSDARKFDLCLTPSGAAAAQHIAERLAALDLVGIEAKLSHSLRPGHGEIG